MSTKGIIGVGGLKTSGNQLTFPPGTLVAAENVMFANAGEAQPRRGHKYHPSIYVDNDPTDAHGNRAREMWQWNDNLLIHYLGDAGSKVSLWAAMSSSPTYYDLGSFTEPSLNTLRMKFAALAKSVYWTTDAGLFTLDAVGGTARAAGVAKPRDFFVSDSDGGLWTRLTGNPNDTGSWMPKDSAVAYHAVCGKKDSNGVVKLSAPNGRCVVINPADVAVVTGSLVRTGGSTVHATVAAHNFRVGDVFALSPGDAGRFDAGNYTVTAVSATGIFWTDSSHGNTTSTVDQTLSSGFKSVQLAIGLSGSQLAAGDLIQVYRTAESAAAAIDPRDEAFQAYERTLTASDIAAGFVTIQDTTPSFFLGAPLETNANTGDGTAAGANERPPLCRDIAVWDGRLWGAHTTDRHRLLLRLIGVGSPAGLQSGDVVCVNEKAFKVGTNFDFLTTFLPSTNIDRTLTNLAYAVQFSTAGLIARKVYDGDSPLGEVTLEEVGLTGSGLTGGAIYAGCDRASAWADAMPKVFGVSSAVRLSNIVTVQTSAAHGLSIGQEVFLAYRADDTPDANFAAGRKTVAVTGSDTFTYGEAGSNASLSGAVHAYVYRTTLKSDQGEQLVRFSKPGEPEAWPLPFFLGGLPDGADVLRIKPTATGNALMVFLAGGDIFRVSGSYPYVVRRFDGTATLIAPDSLVEHSGELYCFTTQGIVSVSDAGVGIVGLDVEDDLRALLNLIGGDDPDPDLARGIFGISYESDHQYVLFAVSPDGSEARAYVYHSLLQQFTTWSVERSCGLVFKGQDRLFLGGGVSNHLLMERKAFGSSAANFADEEHPLTVNGAQSNVSQLTLLSTTGGDWSAEVGDLLKVGSTNHRVVSVETAFKLTIDATVSVTDGQTLTLMKSYEVTLTFAPDAAGAPGIESHFREVQLHFGAFLAQFLSILFSNERDDTGTVTRTDADFVLSQEEAGITLVRAGVPNDVQRGTTLSVTVSLKEAMSFFKLLGISKTVETVSEKTGR